MSVQCYSAATVGWSAGDEAERQRSRRFAVSARHWFPRRAARRQGGGAARARKHWPATARLRARADARAATPGRRSRQRRLRLRDTQACAGAGGPAAGRQRHHSPWLPTYEAACRARERLTQANGPQKPRRPSPASGASGSPRNTPTSPLAHSKTLRPTAASDSSPTLLSCRSARSPSGTSGLVRAIEGCGDI